MTETASPAPAPRRSGHGRRAAGPARVARPAPPSGLVLLLWGVAIAVVTVDQLTKAWAMSALSDGHRIRVLGDVLGLVLVRNPGAAFSFATGQTWIFTMVAVVVTVIVIRVSRRLGTRWWAVTLGLILGGAVGNLIDRLVRDPGVFRGHVVDFIDYAGFFVGNVADIAIVGAAVAVIVLSLIGLEIDGTRGAETRRGQAAAAAAVLGEDALPAGAGAAAGAAAGAMEPGSGEPAFAVVPDEPAFAVVPDEPEEAAAEAAGAEERLAEAESAAAEAASPEAEAAETAEVLNSAAEAADAERVESEELASLEIGPDYDEVPGSGLAHAEHQPHADGPDEEPEEEL